MRFPVPSLSQISRFDSIGRRLVFHHIPKCGGTSIRRAIARHYAPSAMAHLDARASLRSAQLLGEGLDLHRQELLLYLMARGDLRFVSGHFAFSQVACDEFGEEWDFLTMLRHPVSRWFSHYFFNRYKPDAHFKLHDDLPTFLDSGQGRRLGRYYVDKFCGVSNTDPSLDGAIESAKENLARLSVVGCLERLDHFLDDFERHYGVRLRVGHSMKGPMSEAQQDDRITDELRLRVEEICRPDLELYEFAVSGRARRASA